MIRSIRSRSYLIRLVTSAGGAALLLLSAPRLPLHRLVESGQALAAPGTRPTIVVYKSKRRLFYFENDILKRRYSVVLGKRPTGRKERQGDLRTPEGEYYVTTKNENSRFYRFLGLSYPNVQDAKRGFLSRLISRADFHRIRQAIKTGEQPPWETALGGYIGIHGEGEYRGFTKRHRINWTDGCISLSDKDMKVLYGLVGLGTPVLIFP